MHFIRIIALALHSRLHTPLGRKIPEFLLWAAKATPGPCRCRRSHFALVAIE